MGSSRTAAIAALVGFAVMGIELTAVRLMAPHFGDSTYVWTNVIGVILVALALGAWLGGRAAGGGASGTRTMATVLLVGGAWTGIVPFFADSLGEWLVPFDLPLDAATDALVFGSLCGTVILFAPAVLLAGMVTPMLVSARVTGGADVGRASGLVAALSTLGSLVGTFAATHALVPGIGSRLTFAVCAVGLVCAGALARFGAGRVGIAAVPILALCLIPAGQRGSVGTEMELIVEVESPYQFLAVVRSEQGGKSTTELQINEGLDSFHSIAIEGSPYTGGRYYDYFASMPFLRTDGEEPRQLKLLSLGAAAGTFERLIDGVCIDTQFESVELDPFVVDLAQEYFGGFPEGTQVFSDLDARVYVNRTKGVYDLVFVDAYERQVYIPAHVASIEFFESVKKCLAADGGIVAINAGGAGFDDPVVATVARTMATVFGSASVFSVPRSRNCLIAARHGGAPLDPSILHAVQVEDPRLSKILTTVANPSRWREFGPGQPVLTDDRPFLDRTFDRSLRRSIGTETLLAMRGHASVADAEREAYAAFRADDLPELERAVTSASTPSGRLRLHAGDLRWFRRDLLGARAEYTAAARLCSGAPVLREVVDGRIASLSLDIEQHERAMGVGRRNGGLAIALAALLGGVGLAMGRMVGRPVASTG